MISSTKAPCPFCQLTVLSSELERHANSHFESEDEYERQEKLSRDWELAQQIARAPYSPASPFSSSPPRKRTTFHKVGAGMMTLLKNCLELEAGNSTSILSGYVDHFQSIESEDDGWGCGWRNIQMLSSHLLMHREKAREVLFGGSGFVPDIPSLQRWLEIAWEQGFDEPGSEHFHHRIYGSKSWIGTTECAALFRSFGLRARVVDFGQKELKALYLSVPGSDLGAQDLKINESGKRIAVQVCGPMDRYVVRENHDYLEAGSTVNEKPRYSASQLGNSSEEGRGDEMSNKCTRKNKGPQVLIDWVWNYFSDNSLSKSGDHRVIVSEKLPLYFQHDGHSRTIVGIQVKHQQKGMQQYSLLILDPAHRTAALERSLKENDGWQKHIKRGIHTLRKPQYQLCYIDPGIASGEEMELLKRIDSIFLEL
ncbi:Zinc finger with UFM1-specific peptidase domain protein [Morella rubra]|uniref:Zinc finger with UFM1-specific peptidase domain protein n=1 Tax=Morella rubra TaxID=262757 RepID=A0A6A1VSL8_9ROSI|nr:Zinc finger with UFM1-specific peptidase domain protein [Morella rubra]